jgi:hypothetical protein
MRFFLERRWQGGKLDIVGGKGLGTAGAHNE